MKTVNWNSLLSDNRISRNHYPVAGICVVMALVCLSPFLWSVPSYVAFLLCLWRMVRYDARVFAVDYCALLPFTQIFRAGGGLSLLLCFALIATVWHLFKGTVRGDLRYAVLLVLMNFLVARMQLNINKFLLCFGQLLMLCVMLPKQDDRSAARAAQAFCWGLLIASVYAYVFRNTRQLLSIQGEAVEAVYGSGVYRFKGTLADPNYYMTMLITGVTVLVKLLDCRWIKFPVFVLLGGAFALLGVLTYSKTFFLMLVLVALIYVIWQFYSKRYVYGGVLVGMGLLVGIWALVSDSSPLAVVLARFGSGGINAITTGRTEVYLDYLRESASSLGSLLFGKGLDAEGLYKAPHNMYIELIYYIGILGLGLFVSFFAAMVGALMKKDPRIRQQHFISRYSSVIMLAVLFFTLHGMFQSVFYGDAFVMLLAVLILPNRREEKPKRNWIGEITKLVNYENPSGNGKAS